jgi:hypothetical protein
VQRNFIETTLFHVFQMYIVEMFLKYIVKMFISTFINVRDSRRIRVEFFQNLFSNIGNYSSISRDFLISRIPPFPSFCSLSRWPLPKCVSCVQPNPSTFNLVPTNVYRFNRYSASELAARGKRQLPPAVSLWELGNVSGGNFWPPLALCVSFLGSGAAPDLF